MKKNCSRSFFYLLTSFLLLFVSSGAFAQTSKLAGTVRDNTGTPLQGATVSVEGTGVVTSTDDRGQFSVNAAKGSTIVISAVGFENYSFRADGSPMVQISLKQSSATLDDVVVVGYGTIRKRDFTGASTGISAKVIAETPATTLENALQGRMAGVSVTNTSAEPGGGINIMVRGATSLSGGNQPLYVIDGVPQYNDASRSPRETNGNVPGNFMANLNPNDIESVEVLKDASSAAIYGSRGANGVIMITTKKGKAGRGVVNLNYYTTVAMRPKLIPLANARQFAEFVNQGSLNSGGEKVYDGIYKKANNNTDSLYFPKPEELGEGTNWQREIFRNSMTHNVQLTMSGGNDNIRYLLSGNYLDDQGVVKYSSYKKGTLRANIDAKLNERLTATLNINVAQDKNDRAESTNTSSLPGGTSPSGVILKSLLASPTLSTDNQAYRVWLLLPDRTSAAGMANPLLDLANTINERAVSFTQSTLDLIYKISNSLNLTVRGGYYSTSSNNDMYWSSLTALGYDRGQRTFQSTWNAKSYINENFLTFNKSTSKYSINAVVGGSVQRDMGRGTSLTGELLSVPTDNGLYLFPLYQNRGIPTTDLTKSFLVSGFGRASFSYDNKYLITLTGRADASSKFAENKKWAFFPSVGIGWNFTEEKFMSGSGLLTNGKLRASYGSSGNQAIQPYQSLASLSPLSFGFVTGPITGVATNTAENKELTWETTKQLNVGLDLEFSQGRYRLTLDAYRKTTDNLLQAKSIPSASGYATILANFGSIQNQGLEMEFGATIVQQKNFSWDVAFNASHNKNKILDLGEGVEFYNASSNQNDYSHRLRVGGTLGDFWGYQTIGILTAKDVQDNVPRIAGSTSEGDIKIQNTNGDALINDNDKVYLGNAFPKVVLGFTNNFRFRNWSADVFLQGSFGHKIMNQNLSYSRMGSMAGIPSQEYLSDYWTPENTDAYFPRPSFSAFAVPVNDRIIESGDFLRVKLVTLRYQLPVVPKWISRIQLYVTGNNLITITNYSGYDPEVSGYGQSILTPGIDLGSYPRTRSFTFGVDLRF